MVGSTGPCLFWAESALSILDLSMRILSWNTPLWQQIPDRYSGNHCAGVLPDVSSISGLIGESGTTVVCQVTSLGTDMSAVYVAGGYQSA